MVDPFFTANNNQNNNQWENAETTQQTDGTQQTIDNLMSQQHQIQEKYKELKALLQNETLTENQQQEVHEQMQKLSDLYSQNKATLTSLTTNIAWEKEIHVNKNIDTENSKWKSFSFKRFMVGCGVLLMLFLWWIVVIFSSLMKDPNRLVGFWIDWCTAVSLLQIFSIVFFWILFFWWLALLLININRLIVTKNKKKFPYAIWAIFSFIILITVWILLVNMLQNLSIYSQECGDRWDTKLAHPHFVVKDSKYRDTYLPVSEQNKVIAPINVAFDLNTTEYKNRIVKLWAVNITNVALSCWNWDNLQVNNLSIEWTCFYMKAWTYQPEIVITYIDASQTQKEQRYIIGQDVSIKSEIAISSNKDEVKSLNSALLIWKNPVTLKFDSSAIFRDFNLPYHISWSPECDWIPVFEDNVEISYEYANEWLFEACVMFPSLSTEYIYTFPIRVEQWEVQDKFEVLYAISTNNSSETKQNPDSIIVTELPTTLTIDVLSVTPDNSSVQRKLYKDWEQIAAEFSNKNMFKVVIDEDKTQELILEITNSEKQITTQIPINVTVNKQDYVWVLRVIPDTVWNSPFEVTLDASTTSLKDSDDEIVWFSWDFWDWVKNKDTSTAIVTHEYAYDFVNEKGVFYPTVTLQTKKWKIFTITGIIINVKKPESTLEINLDDNPAQLANVLQSVPISITLDWLPKKISRDFWDGETLECDWRLCSETSHVYTVAWSYTISVKVEFEDKQTLNWKINLVVK